jgi:hypothetical protein
MFPRLEQVNFGWNISYSWSTGCCYDQKKMKIVHFCFCASSHSKLANQTARRTPLIDSYDQGLSTHRKFTHRNIVVFELWPFKVTRQNQNRLVLNYQNTIPAHFTPNESYRPIAHMFTNIKLLINRRNISYSWSTDSRNGQKCRIFHIFTIRRPSALFISCTIGNENQFSLLSIKGYRLR